MKKKYLPEKRTGIWIDQNEAFLIKLEEEKAPVIQHIRSEIESRVRIKGEGKVSARFGNAFIDDQEKKQRRQQHERKRYFDEIIDMVRNDDYIFLFGPSQGKEELNNAFEKEHSIKAKIILIEPADRLTENQMLEKTLSYFNSDEFKSARRKIRRTGSLVH